MTSSLAVQNQLVSLRKNSFKAFPISSNQMVSSLLSVCLSFMFHQLSLFYLSIYHSLTACPNTPELRGQPPPPLRLSNSPHHKIRLPRLSTLPRRRAPHPTPVLPSASRRLHKPRIFLHQVLQILHIIVLAKITTIFIPPSHRRRLPRQSG